jgi:hypothetical protein
MHAMTHFLALVAHRRNPELEDFWRHLTHALLGTFVGTCDGHQD